MNLYRSDRRDVWMAAVLAVAGLVWLIAWSVAWGQALPTAGMALYARGCTRAIYRDSTPAHGIATSPFNPRAALDLDRYGDAVRTGVSWGPLAGERVSTDAITEYVRQASNPLGIANNGSYACDYQCHGDFDLVTCDGRQNAYDSIVAPWLASQQPPQPTATPAPTATPKPPCLSPDCQPHATPTPPAPQPTPVASPTPAVPPCPAATPCPTCKPAPQGALAALAHVLSGDWLWIGKGRRAQLAPLQPSSGMIEQCLEVKP